MYRYRVSSLLKSIFKFHLLFQLNLKSPPKDVDELADAEVLTKLAEKLVKDPKHVPKKERTECSQTFDKGLDKLSKTKPLALPCLPSNDDFFPRRSERIFLSSSSSMNSPTASGGFEIPSVNKKKPKAPSGKIVKKKVCCFKTLQIGKQSRLVICE